MDTLKNKIFIIVLIFFMVPLVCWAADLESLKVDFLQGNYRRVIFEGQAQITKINIGNTDELNYILGLSYLKEKKLDLAQDCFLRVLNNQRSKLKAQATLSLADTFLIGGQFQGAEEIYNKLINDQPNINLKAAVLYRLSELEFKRGNNKPGNDYLSKLKMDFPLSSELKFTRGLDIDYQLSDTSVKVIGEYSVQVGFFSSQNNASKFRDKLLTKNFPAYIQSSSGGYRVRVGRFKTQKEAYDLEDRLSRGGFQTKVCP